MADLVELFFLISSIVEFTLLLEFIPIPSTILFVLSSGPVSTSSKTPATFFPFTKMSLGHFISGFSPKVSFSIVSQMQIAEIITRKYKFSSFNRVSKIRDIQMPPLGEYHVEPFLPFPQVCELQIITDGLNFFFLFTRFNAKFWVEGNLSK